MRPLKTVANPAVILLPTALIITPRTPLALTVRIPILRILQAPIVHIPPLLTPLALTARPVRPLLTAAMINQPLAFKLAGH